MDNDFATGYIAGQQEGGNRGGMFGCGGDFIWILVFFALIFGWGGGGFGGAFGGGGAREVIDTRSAISEGFGFNNLDNGIRGVQNGLCDGFYAVNTSLLNGFHGVDNAIHTLGFQNQQCCCETQRLIERGFCDTIQSGHNDTDRVIAKLDQMENARQQEKIEALRLENQALRFQASQLDQNATIRAAIDAATAEIIRRTGNAEPMPAYVVPNPNCCYGNPVGVSFANGGWGQQNACCGHC